MNLSSGGLLIRFLPIISTSIINTQIVITEVLFDPECIGTNQEFVEILNLGSFAVDINGWALTDNNSTDELFPEFSSLGAGEFGVILEQDYTDCFELVFPDEVNIIFVDDNSIGNGLGNSSDELFLINTLGDTVSEMSWTNGITHGHSLEKVVPEFENIPENWRESINILGTPGSENSVSSQLIDVG
ncbi:MAG: lamin tail domain-containing protein, partial [Fidelibacterota bacterium]